MNPLVAHPRTTELINKIIESPSNTIAISGEDGAGKGYIATHIVGKILNNEAISVNPYVLKLDASAQGSGIDDIRNIQKFLTLKVPGSNKYKRAVIVENVDKLGHEAQNSFLKTLEEPPIDTILVVTYRNNTTILPTIKSRVQEVRVLSLDLTTAQRDFSSYTKEEVLKAYHLSEGQPGLMFSLLQNDSEHPLVQAVELAKKILRMTKYQRLSQVDQLIKSKDTPPHLILDSLYRLIRAGYKQSAASSSPNTQANLNRLYLIDEAATDLAENVQSKIVFNRLFMHL